MNIDGDGSAQNAATAFLEALTIPAILLDASRKIVVRNKMARGELNIELVGSDLSRSFRNPALFDAVDQVLRSNGTVKCELQHGTAPARTYEVSVSNVELNPESYALLVFFDLTTERQVENVRSTFVSNVSHELRSPLTTVMGACEALGGAAGDNPVDRLRMLTLMNQESLRMKNLIDDLLSLSRVEANEYVNPSQPVNVTPLLDRARDRMTDGAAQRDMTIIMDVADNIRNVLGVDDELLQVFDNLIGNAVKYGGQGSTINIRAGETDQGLCVSFHNWGPPISSEHLPRLTERFYRVEKSRSRGLGGTGLGLAIVKHIVNRHRGTLSIESSEETGTTFSVTLPFSA
jgi:two-component system phosphate regulon sensor histidine kinase PhoR